MSSDPEIEFLGTSIAIRTLPAQSYQYVSSSSRPFSSSTTAIDLTSLSDSDEDTTINRPFSSTSPTALKAAPYAKASIPINYGTSKTKLLGKQRANELSLYAERRAERAQSNWPGEQQPAPTHDIQPSLAENGLSPQLSTDGADASRTVDGYHKRPASTSARAIQNRTAYEIIELSDSDDPPPTPRKRQRIHASPPILPCHTQSRRVATPLFLPHSESSDEDAVEIVQGPPLSPPEESDCIDVDDPKLWDNMPSTNRRRRQTPSDYSIDVARELSAALEALKIRTHDPSPTQTLRRERDCQPALPPLDKTTQPPGDQLTVRLHEAERRAVRRVRGRHKDVEQGRQLLQDFLDQTREDRGLPVLDGETLNAPGLLRYIRGEEAKRRSAVPDGPTVADPRPPPRTMRYQTPRCRVRPRPNVPPEEDSDEDMYV